MHEKLSGRRISVGASGAGGGWTYVAADLRYGGGKSGRGRVNVRRRGH